MTTEDSIEALTIAHYPENWTEADTVAVDTARMLAAEAVQNCGSGHPGTAMSLAPIAYYLYQYQMRHNPLDTQWAGRDRFVLSCGHSSLTQYVQLFLGGFGLEMDDLKALRTWGALTPGHPEYGHTDGVEITTGPLGQGLASAVGMAMAARRERGLFDPQAPEGESPFDHNIYVIASDGDIQEGITAEACSLAGTQQLGNLICLYDDNRISIEDDTQIAFTEDVAARYEAYGWQVLKVAGGENISALAAALNEATADTSRPTMIIIRTIIGYPAPNKMNTGGVHGAALGQDELSATAAALGMQDRESFTIDADVLAHSRSLQQRGQAAQAEWEESFSAWASAQPQSKQLWDRLMARELPQGWDENLPSWEADPQGIPTRKASGEVLQALGATLPELWGGSADLAESNLTPIKGEPSFGPEAITTSAWTTHPYGRNLHFGIREHAMGAIINGIALHGPTRPYAATFLIFSDYMRPAVRLASLMNIDTYYVWTHDSIGLGEDGPTHQPIEQLASLRAIPGVAVIRPADANETAAAWRHMIIADKGPKALALSRQNLPVLAGTVAGASEGVAAGAYVVSECEGTPDVVLIATGSEVHLAVAAAEELQAGGVQARVVSMPCAEWFDGQEQSYRDSIIPPQVEARVSVEAGCTMSWFKYVGTHGRTVGIDHFGASAGGSELFTRFGITVENVVAAAQDSISSVKGSK